MVLTRAQRLALQSFTFAPSNSSGSANTGGRNRKRRRCQTKSADTTTTPLETSPPKKRRRVTKRVRVAYEDEKDHSGHEDSSHSPPPQIGVSPFISLTDDLKARAKGAPKNWDKLYDGILDMRSSSDGIGFNADVDHIGCACLSDPDAPIKRQRFHVLVGLLLSSQTRDKKTAQAVENLKEKYDGLTVDAICEADESEIDECIKQVGFHRRKAGYLKRVAHILKNEYDGDIPNTLSKLSKLPGIGPKMSFLCLQVAWGKNLGIGVDVHVHRISHFFGWASGKNPETTRKELEEWLPRELWPGINRLLVGFGQTVCYPRNPRCYDCKVHDICPVGKKYMRSRRPPKSRR